jgi:oligopeptidase A
MDTGSKNLLLALSEFPDFRSIKPEDVVPAIESLLDEARRRLADVTKSEVPATWAAVERPLENVLEPFHRVWSTVQHLVAVADAPALRGAYSRALPMVSAFSTELAQNEALYGKYKHIREGREYNALSPAQQRLLGINLRAFRRGGVELPVARKHRIGEIHQRLAMLGKKFSENVLDATNAFALWIHDEVRLSGLPEAARMSAGEAARSEGKEGWKFSLQLPSLIPVLQHADDRAFREQLFKAFITRSSDLAPTYAGATGDWDNTALMQEMLGLRAKLAELLGFPSYAELSLDEKMAASLKEVFGFLSDLARRARPQALAEWAELQQFAQQRLHIDALEPWDVAYVSEKLRRDRYSVFEEMVTPHFPEDRVLDGLFGLATRLFGVQIRRASAPVWDDHVRFYRVDSVSGTELAHFYLDLYARPNKRSGAWMSGLRSRRAHGGTITTPVAFIACNFRSPSAGQANCLKHDEIITLFHEFGHALHHMLTRVDEAGVAGTSGVEWDAIELPSQLMENFAWEWEVLRSMSAHVETGQPLSRDLFERMRAARNFLSGLTMLRQIVPAVFDMRVHAQGAKGAESDLVRLVREVNEEFHVQPQPTFARWPHSFLHIFSHNYAAGYYSYKWAEVLSADVFAAFEEMAVGAGSVLDPKTGRQYLDEILAVGGSRPAMESFKSFRGRKPELSALLRHRGIESNINVERSPRWQVGDRPAGERTLDR